MRQGGATFNALKTEASQLQKQGASAEQLNQLQPQLIGNAVQNAKAAPPAPPTNLQELVSQGGPNLTAAINAAKGVKDLGFDPNTNRDQIIQQAPTFAANEKAAAQAQADAEMIVFYPPGGTSPIKMTPEQFFDAMKDPSFKDLISKSTKGPAQPISGGAAHALNNGLLDVSDLVLNEETGMLESPEGFNPDGNYIGQGKTDSGTKVPTTTDPGLFDLFGQMSPDKRKQFSEYVNNKLVGSANPQDPSKTGAGQEIDPNIPLDEEEAAAGSTPAVDISPEESFGEAFFGSFRGLPSSRGTVSGNVPSGGAGVADLSGRSAGTAGVAGAPQAAGTQANQNVKGLTDIAKNKVEQGAQNLQKDLRFSSPLDSLADSSFDTEVPDSATVIDSVNDYNDAFGIGEKAVEDGSVNITDKDGNVVASLDVKNTQDEPKLGKNATKKVEAFLKEEGIEIDFKRDKKAKDNVVSNAILEGKTKEETLKIIENINKAFATSDIPGYNQLMAQRYLTKNGKQAIRILKTKKEFSINFNPGKGPGSGGQGAVGTFTSPDEEGETVLDKEDEATGNYFDSLADDFFGDGGIVDIVRGTTGEQGETFGVANEALRNEIESLGDPNVAAQVKNELDVIKQRGQEQIRDTFNETLGPVLAQLRSNNFLYSNVGGRIIANIADDVMNKGVLELTRELAKEERNIKNDIVNQKLSKIEKLSGVKAPEIPERLPFLQNVPSDRLPEKVSFSDMFNALKVFAKDVPESAINRMADFLTNFLNNSTVLDRNPSTIDNIGAIANAFGQFIPG